MNAARTDRLNEPHRWARTGLFLFLTMLLGLGASAQAPTNDNFANAQVISGSSGTITGGNGGATKETGEPNHAGYNGGHSVWYSWTAPSSQFAAVDTKGSNFSPAFAIYTGTAVDQLSPVAGASYSSSCYFTPAAGTTYYIAVDSTYSGSTGTVILNWKQLAPPANDNFAKAQAIAGKTSSVKGTVLAATKEDGEPDHYYSNVGHSVWYRWTAPSTGSYAFTTNGDSFYPVIAVYTGSSVNSLTKVPTSYSSSKSYGQRAVIETTAGTSYSIAVDSSNAASYGNFSLTWASVPRPPNDNFANARPISGKSGSTGGTTEAATKETSEPNHAGQSAGHSVWYRWTAPETGAFEFLATGYNFTPALAVYSGSSVGSLTEITSNSYDPNYYQSRVVLDASAGVTYSIAIDSTYASSFGSFTLTWLEGVRPANDFFANAQSIAGTSGMVSGTNSFATGEANEPYPYQSRSVWYKWTPISSGMVTFSTAGSDFDTYLAAYTGSSISSLSTVANNDDDVPLRTSWLAFRALAGTTYYIKIDGYSGAEGHITLTWNQGGSDFDRDGMSDLVWQNTQTGDATVWYLNNGGAWSGLRDTFVKGFPLNQKIVGVTDFDGDGKPDLLWQNQSNGDVAVWYMEGGGWSGRWDYIWRGIPLAWKINGLADLDGDGKIDLIWQNTQTGDLSYWLMDGIKKKSTGYISHGLSTTMRLAGTGDFDGDGKADLVWQDSANGDVLVWYLDGVTWAGRSDYIVHGMSAAWQVAAILDANFDGRQDIVWQNTQTGDVSVWYMNGAVYTNTWNYIVRGVPTTWKIVHTH